MKPGDDAPKIVIYNPNTTNSYGLELASALQRGGARTTVLCPKGLKSAIPPGVQAVSNLAGERGSDREWLRAIKRLIGPVRASLAAGKDGVLIVAWCRDPWDAFVFWVRARTLRRTMSVLHNPRSVRGPSGATRAEMALHRAALPIVHTRWLQQAVARDLPGVRVAPHPPYVNLLRLAPPSVQLERRFAFIGALRPDKGAEILLDVARLTERPWTLRFVGAGRVPDGMVAALEQQNVRVENEPNEYRPDDRGLVAAARQSIALLAPYKSVTTSGTMVLAASLGLPIITFAAASVAEMFPGAVTAASAEELAGIIDSTNSDQAQPADLASWPEATTDGWLGLVRDVR